VARRVRPILHNAVERSGEEAANLARISRERAIYESLRHNLDEERWFDGLPCMAGPRLQHFDERDPFSIERLVLGRGLSSVNLGVALDPPAKVSVGDLVAAAQGDRGHGIDR